MNNSEYVYDNINHFVVKSGKVDFKFYSTDIVNVKKMNIGTYNKLSSLIKYDFNDRYMLIPGWGYENPILITLKHGIPPTEYPDFYLRPQFFILGDNESYDLFNAIKLK